jgi:hypothetical protein
MTLDSEEIWDIKDTAAFLRCKEIRIYQLIKRCGLPCFRLNPTWKSGIRFKKSDVVNWIEDQRKLTASLADKRKTVTA